MKFVAGEIGSTRPVFPFAVLKWSTWDDYSRKTSFHVQLHISHTSLFDLGMVKVLKMDGQEGPTVLPTRFDSLGTDFVSLGQAANYYETLSALPPKLARDYLVAMRDVASSAELERSASEVTGWRSSLLRFGEAENALKVGRTLFGDADAARVVEADVKGRLEFDFDWNHHGVKTPLSFSFNDTGAIPGRWNAIVGYNGVGKTALLADLAVAASGVGDDRRTDVRRSQLTEGVTFGAVVAVSYSAFDTFATPEFAAAPGGVEQFGYVYCGLRRIGSDQNANKRDARSLKSIDEVEAELEAAADRARDGIRGARFDEALKILMTEPSFSRIGVDLDVASSVQQLIAEAGRLSTGHKIVLNIIAQLSAHLVPRSLVLLDEPETHLHPPLMGALLRAVQALLNATDSFAVIATHSPVVIQETPARNVRILERYGTDTSSRLPDIESYGESVGAITRHIFSLDSSATDFQGVLQRLALDMTLEEIDSLFESGLSGQARALVRSYAFASRREQL